MGKQHVNYALEPKPMGIGGQAEVFRACDKRTNQLVAFKRLLPNLRMDQDAIARMRREIDVQSVINHPNIMPILDYSEHYYWYTMPLAEKSLMDMPTPMEFKLILQIIKEVASGLEFAHKLGNIHRDITPRNILELKSIDGISRWVISDWGLVRRIGNTSVIRTNPGYQYGTDGFAAPEAGYDAHLVDARADVYSLGRVVAWCVSGIWPIQNIPFCPEGPLQDFISRTTKLYPHERVGNMSGILVLVKELE